MPDYSTVLQESRHKRRAVVLEKKSGYTETGNFVVLTSTSFFKEEDATAFYAAEAARRIKKGGGMNEQT